MEALSVLSVVDKTGEDEAGRPNTIITLTEKFSWFTSNECSSLIERRNYDGSNLTSHLETS
jgi:hypothetical protein